MSYILVDMDNVLANFDAGHVDACIRAGYDKTHHGVGRATWDMLENFAPEVVKKVERLWHEPGYFRTLEPLDGAVYGVKRLVQAGHEVFICTAPLRDHKTVAREKLEWVEEHFGRDLVSRVIITRDKTMVHGDYLIDDKPGITGARTPSWKHLLFEASYNLGQPTVNWRSLVGMFCSTSTGT